MLKYKSIHCPVSNTGFSVLNDLDRISRRETSVCYGSKDLGKKKYFKRTTLGSCKKRRNNI